MGLAQKRDEEQAGVIIKSLSFLHIARLQKNKSVSKIRQFRDPLLGYFKTLLQSYQKYKLEVDKLPNVSFRFLGISGIIPFI